jgi:putative transposase
MSERQPLFRPMQANQVWLMDFVFEWVTTGRTIKCLTIVDDGTHEAVGVAPERSISGHHLTRILDGYC